jgi:hypothetical protein
MEKLTPVEEKPDYQNHREQRADDKRALLKAAYLRRCVVRTNGH